MEYLLELYKDFKVHNPTKFRSFIVKDTDIDYARKEAMRLKRKYAWHVKYVRITKRTLNADTYLGDIIRDRWRTADGKSYLINDDGSIEREY